MSNIEGLQLSPLVYADELSAIRREASQYYELTIGPSEDHIRDLYDAAAFGSGVIVAVKLGERAKRTHNHTQKETLF